jgi:putative oxidoreductase
VFGWFSGPGIEGAGQMMEGLEPRPGRRSALAAGVAEAAGGAMFALAALTPLAGAGLVASMVTAIRKVHLDKGFWKTAGGYEFNLTLSAAVVAMVDSGPGSPSVGRRPPIPGRLPETRPGASRRPPPAARRRAGAPRRRA